MSDSPTLPPPEAGPAATNRLLASLARWFDTSTTPVDDDTRGDGVDWLRAIPCLGMHLARLETREAVDAVLDLLPGVRLVPGRSAPARGLVFRKPGSVGAAWDVSRRAPTGKA